MVRAERRYTRHGGYRGLPLKKARWSNDSTVASACSQIKNVQCRILCAYIQGKKIYIFVLFLKNLKKEKKECLLLGGLVRYIYKNKMSQVLFEN